MVKNSIKVTKGYGDLVTYFLLKTVGANGSHFTSKVSKGFDIIGIQTKDSIIDDIRKFSEKHSDLPIDFSFEISGMTVETQFIGGIDLNEQFATFMHERKFL